VKSPNSNDWYICVDSHVSQGDTDGTYINEIDKSLYTNTTSELNTNYWEEFGANFESVATNLLLTDIAYVGNKLIVGDQSNNPGSIISNGDSNGSLFIGGFDDNGNKRDPEDYNTAGFRLEKVNQTTALFDVGGTTNAGVPSYIRFSSKTKKIEIRGGFTNNSVEANINIASLTSADPQAVFIGGGYNNKIEKTEPDGQNFNSLASSIVGGASNEIEARFSFIGNGFGNQCRDNFSAIVAGYNNNMPKADDLNEGANFIGAGQANSINGGTNNSIVGGNNNNIEGGNEQGILCGESNVIKN